MKTTAMKHQLTALQRMEGKRNYAVFAEQGTGKTFMTLADAERLFIGNRIDALLVFAPRGVHSNWVLREIPKHLEIDSVCFAWKKPTTKKLKAAYDALYFRDETRHALRVFTINYEAMLTKAGKDAVNEFLNCFRVLAVADESKKIANPKTKRTVAVIAAGRKAEARRILSGKPLTKAPMDLFSQFDFLQPGLLGTTSYRAFVAEYAVLMDHDTPQFAAIARRIGANAQFAQIVETDSNGEKLYRNLDKLANMVAPHTYRVRKDECLDLPEKIYKQVYFELDDEQRNVYDKLETQREFISKTDGEMSFEAIAARTKMKQVTSGFVNVYGQPEFLEPNKNPRMEAFIDVVENTEGQFIVWAIYREEIRQIAKVLESMGISVAQYHGGIKDDDREKAVDDFQAGKVRAFVCNKAAYAGLTLTAAQTSIYFSTDYDNDIRSQSEDRCHRIGTTGHVLYVDLIAENTIDEEIARSIALKNRIADRVIDGIGGDAALHA